jgi:hypothetical protein
MRGGLIGTFLVGIISCQSEPLRKNAPEIASKLTDLKTACESNVQALKQEGIDGRTKYEKAQRAANSCISYLTTALADAGGDETTMRKQLANVEKETNLFLAWADDKLHAAQAGRWLAYLAPYLTALLEYARKEDKQRRDDLIRELDKCKFRSWSDIQAGTGAVK